MRSTPRSAERIDAPVMWSLYGSRDPAGAGRIAMSTALVICNLVSGFEYRCGTSTVSYLPRLNENPYTGAH